MIKLRMFQRTICLPLFSLFLFAFCVLPNVVVSVAIANAFDNDDFHLTVSGTAYSLDGFLPLYIEQYYVGAASIEDKLEAELEENVGGDQRNNVRQSVTAIPSVTRVVYRESNNNSSQLSAEGQIFALKTVDFAVSSVAPSFTLIDFRLGQLQASNYGIASSDGAAELSMYTFDAGKTETLAAPISPFDFPIDSDADKTLALSDSFMQRKKAQVPSEALVTDAGFDNFIRENWNSMVAMSKRQEFEFAVPSRGQSVAMRIEKINATECERVVFTDVPASIAQKKEDFSCFKLVAKNWVVAQVLKPIYLVYDEEKRLQIFRGLSNIRAADNGKLRVFIRYQYP